ncbi:MAG TPA: hypothetical protein DCG54_07565 [Anaerolineae bacterium]|jgi:Tfp pilus assembly protein PilO|nr:hypothetical protein [Anaerolineae bacterium]
MPSSDVWLQFQIVAVLVLATVLIAGALYKFWKDLLAWQEKQEALRAAEREQQDSKREIERDKQRVWEAEQAKQRDQQWQLFLRNMQEQWITNDQRNSAVLTKLVEQINDLTVSINNHDTFVRASNGSADRPAAPKRRTKSFTETQQ